MNFPMVAFNVLAVFAVFTAVACWLYALVAIHHRKMKTAEWVPPFAGIIAGLWLASREDSAAVRTGSHAQAWASRSRRARWSRLCRSCWRKGLGRGCRSSRRCTARH